MNENEKAMAEARTKLVALKLPAKTAKRIGRAVYEIDVALLEVGVEAAKERLRAAKKAS